jgi:hypothetical protein
MDDFEDPSMTDALNGFYAAYLSGKAAQAFAMLIIRNGKIVGAGAFGEVFDGQYEDAGEGILSVTVLTKSPPNMAAIQGGTTVPDGETDELTFKLPHNFSSQDHLRIETRRGPINVKLVRLRGLDD